MTRIGKKNSRAVWIFFVTTLWAWLALAPVAVGQVPIVHAEFPATTSEIPITQWQMVGPFQFDKKELDAPDADRLPVGLSRDYLKTFGEDESSVTGASFPLIKTSETTTGLAPLFHNGLVSTRPKTNILELASIRHPMDYAVAYVATIVESPRDQEIVIAVGADDNFRLWLNHELVFADLNTIGHGLTKHQRLIGASLKQGQNYLLLKVGNLTGDWRLIVTLYKHERALELADDNAVNPILSTSVVAAGQPLELRGDLLSSSHVQLEIANAHHEPVDSADLSLGRNLTREIGKLRENNLYYCRLSVGEENIERPFYYGDLEIGYGTALQEAGQLTETDESIVEDVDAQLGRLKHLLKPENRKSEFWDQKVAVSFAELEDNFDVLRKGASLFRRTAGTHLRGYRSAVDGQVQHYWIHVPEQALQSGKPIPLVIALPYTTGENHPFLESYFLAAFDETERYRLLGDRYGFAVLQVWGRGNYLGGTAIGTADVFEALDAVQKDYPIDSDRVYLLGYCEGGRQALLLGERYPDRFAAIAVVAPIAILHARSSYASKWIHYSSPDSALQNLRNVPVFISHDEADTPPIEESEDFASRCREAGVDVTLVRRHGGLHGFYQDPMAEKRALFEFVAGKRRQSGPNKIEAKAALLGFNASHGPVEDAFGTPMLVVEGTLGGPAQRAAVHDLAQMLVDQWQKAYFVACPTKEDIEITDVDLRKYNLVIVGDAQTNAVAKQIAEHLPFRTTGNEVSLAGRTYEGTKLGYEFIAPNPLNPGKYVVMIGMNQWSSISGWKLDPSRDGICDYFIFDLQGPTPRLNDAGYFDASIWQKSDSQLSQSAPARASLR